VTANVLRDHIAASQWSRKHESNLPLLNNIGGAVTLPGFGAGVGNQRHADSHTIKVRRLASIADVELNVVRALQR